MFSPMSELWPFRPTELEQPRSFATSGSQNGVVCLADMRVRFPLTLESATQADAAWSRQGSRLRYRGLFAQLVLEELVGKIAAGEA
jgi:hypothetical protein